jgi:glycogen debranching enzyme
MEQNEARESSAQERTWRIDDFYIAATSPRLTADTLVLKHGETFAVFDEHGNIGVGQDPSQAYEGLYHDGTRFLCREELSLNGQPLLLLSSSVDLEGTTVVADLTNPDISKDDTVVLPHGTIHVNRQKVLWDGVYYEAIRVSNYGRTSHEVALGLDFAADFADIFEVRGVRRRRRGQMLPRSASEFEIVFAYRGLDEVLRRSRITWDYPGVADEKNAVLFFLELRPKEERVINVSVACETQTPRMIVGFERARTSLRAEIGELASGDAYIETSNEQFNGWLHRSAADIHTLVSRTESGPFPYAGIPWFSAAFGRDGAITAFQYLMVNPELARGVLSYLAATQADEVDEFSQSEPGKIIHELRGGEMSVLGEVPFRRYYGSVDATPLFVWLAHEYLEHTGDLGFVSALWPSILKAVEWVDTWGDKDQDGFVEYAGHFGDGLENQGWKDSKDAVFHADGRIPAGPIALAEVQAYVYRCRLAAAEIAERLDEKDVAEEQRRKAAALKEAFERAFWCDEIGLYAMALDGRKRPCAIRTSNAGQVLVGGMIRQARAAAVVRSLMSTDFFSGWGIRTVARGEPLYNPMAYHNGSVWPHDNSLIALGMARYGFKAEAMHVMSALFDAVSYFSHMRMPELFCGFYRKPDEGPVLYPVACNPQAWAAGSVFLLLRACLGLEVDASRGRVTLDKPNLPEFLRHVKISGLRCGDSSVSLLFSRHEDDVGVNVLQRDGPVEVVVIK